MVVVAVLVVVVEAEVVTVVVVVVAGSIQEVAALETEARVKAAMPVTTAVVLAVVSLAATACTPVGILSSTENEQAHVLKLPGDLMFHASECATVPA